MHWNCMSTSAQRLQYCDDLQNQLKISKHFYSKAELLCNYIHVQLKPYKHLHSQLKVLSLPSCVLFICLISLISLLSMLKPSSTSLCMIWEEQWASSSIFRLSGWSSATHRLLNRRMAEKYYKFCQYFYYKQWYPM